MKCQWCDHPHASARHFFAECCRLSEDRRRLQSQYNIEASWWQIQPRVTAKSGWITLSAHDNPMQRVQMQIAACSLGFAIMQATEQIKDAAFY